MPAMAARAFRVRCNASGTFRNWIIRDIRRRYSTYVSDCSPRAELVVSQFEIAGYGRKSADYARNGRWHLRSRLVAGRDRDASGRGFPPDEARPLQENQRRRIE